MRKLLIVYSILFSLSSFSQNIGPKLFWGEGQNSFGDYAKAYAFGNDLAIISRDKSSNFTEGRLMLFDENLDTIASKAYSYSEPIQFLEGKSLNDSVFLIAGTTGLFADEHFAFVLALNKDGEIIENFVFDKLSSKSDANIEVVNDTTFLFSFSDDVGELTTTLMGLDGNVKWSDQVTVSNYSKLGDIVYDGNNSIFSFQELGNGSRLVEMDTLGVKQRSIEIPLALNPRQVFLFQDSLYLLVGENIELDLVALNRTNLTVKSQMRLNNYSYLIEGEFPRIVSHLDSSLLMTYSNGYTLVLDNSLNVLADFDYEGGSGVVVMEDSSVVYVKRGPIFGFKSTKVSNPQVAVNKHDTLFVHGLAPTCFPNYQSYEVSSTHFSTIPSTTQANSMNLQFYSGQFVETNVELNTENHCVYYFAGLEDENFSKLISVFPNPTQSILEISTDYRIEEIRIVNVLGKNVSLDTTDSQVLNVAHLPAGVYFVRVRLENGLFATQRFVKE